MTARPPEPPPSYLDGILTVLLWVAVVTVGSLLVGEAFAGVGWALQIAVWIGLLATAGGGWRAGLLDPRRPTLPQRARRARTRRPHAKGRATRKRR